MLIVSKSQLIAQIAERLGAARVNCGYKSRRQFVLTHNLKLTTYRNHELGKTELSIYDALLYAEKMGVSTTWLLFGGESMHQHTNDLDQVSLDSLDSKQNIGKRLEISRKARGYHSRISFSKACAIDATTIRAHEKGLTEITEVRISSFISYFFILDVSLFWLLTGKGNPLTHHEFAKLEALEAFNLLEEIDRMQKKLKKSAS